MSLPKKLYSLPFDQFSRQSIVTDIINDSIRPKKSSKPFNVIDLGGHKGKTQDFLPKDKVTILDVFNERYNNYVKGDATSTKFEDNSFDIACSFDVFEHIPKNKRQDFINESVRISKIGVFLAAPVDNPTGTVSRVEINLNNFYKDIYGKNHRWLKEHIDYKIPTHKDIEALFKSADVGFVKIDSNKLNSWALMQAAIFLIESNPQIGTQVADLNTWFNEHSKSIDTGIGDYYRSIYFFSKNNSIIKSVEEYINHSKHSSTPSDIVAKFHSKLLAILSINQRSFNDLNNTLNNENINIKKQYDELNLKSYNLENEINNIYNSKTWKITKPIRSLLKLRKG